MGKAAELSRQLLGAETRSVLSSKSVDTSAIQIVENNPDRVELVLFNIGAGNLYLGHDSTVTTSNGMFLGSGGSAMMMTVREDGELPSEEWWGVADASTTVVILEVIAK
jgi:hypothetical protein